jgi:hypothetical protein
MSSHAQDTWPEWRILTLFLRRLCEEIGSTRCCFRAIKTSKVISDC